MRSETHRRDTKAPSPTRRRVRALCAFGLSFVVPGAGAGEGVLIERILAVVDGRPLMLSEVQAVERLRGLDRPAALEALIDERLMFQEASRLPTLTVTAEDEERGYRSLVQKAQGAAAGVLEADLRRLARRQLAILKYVEYRFRPQVRVGDEAVRREYEGRYGREPAAPPFAAAAPEIRQRLADRELGALVEDWVRELRASAEIRYNP